MKDKNENLFRTTVGTVLVDLGKLLFGSLFLGSVLRGVVEPVLTSVICVTSAIIFIIAGVIFILKGKE